MSKNYRETENYIFFYGSCFSQWAMRDIEIDGIVYNCCEQAMMADKASLFGDDYAKKMIMASKNPAEQKKWGRKVKNFNKDKWEPIARNIVLKANYAKFTQHEDLKKFLLATGDKIIVEASPTDCIWGIGVYCDDPGITDPVNWRGTNWLGEAIMKVRDVLREEKE
jgi:ribA/ribD-fused uncharacterized protein